MSLSAGVECEAIPAMTVVEQAGVSYRQLDWWTREGLVKANPRPARRPGWPAGSGHPRGYPQSEVEVVIRMGRLVRAGVTARVAAQVARRGDGVTESVLYLLRPVITI